ncbi:Hypothetical predicted protein [Pelobates cultripes]|uniref:Uncharacterized protein n=1 Tax=Pelobates cultripes TaxID=61616 RepID=A0AAD1T9H1_PELCU|nr:Hypothetical predicted protein [Pelobates cultripes]
MQAYPAPLATLQTPATSSVALLGWKAQRKRKHASVPLHTKETPGLTDTPQAVYDGEQQLCNGATGWAKATRNWKQTRGQDMLSDLDKSEEEGSDVPYSDPYEDEISEDEDLAICNLHPQRPKLPKRLRCQT